MALSIIINLRRSSAMTNSLLESIVKLHLGQVSKRSLMPIMITANLEVGIKSKGRPSENAGPSFLIFSIRDKNTLYYGNLLYIYGGLYHEYFVDCCEHQIEVSFEHD